MRKKLIIIISCLVMFTSVGTASWISNMRDSFHPHYIPSSLTNHIKSAQKDTYVYGGGTYTNVYSNIFGDDTYVAATRTIDLGYSDEVLIINQNTYFTHTNSAIQYTESQFNSNSFHTNNGNTDKIMFEKSDGTTQDYYYSSKNNAASSKKTQITACNNWINYYYPDLKFNHYETSTSDVEVVKVTKRLYTVRLVGDIELQEGKTLSIGGFIGATTGAGFAGSVIEGDFVVLDLNGHTLKINKNATLNAYGYIIDTSKDINGMHKGKILNYGTIYSPFIIENYSGGGQTVATGAFGTAPFTLYSVPYLSCRTIFYSTAYLKGPSSLYPNESFNKIVVALIGPSGSNSLIEISSDSSVEKDSYNPVEDGLYSGEEYAQNFKTYFIFNGNIAVNTLKITVKVGITKTINMAEFGFVIPSYNHVIINSGTTTLGMRVDFLPGSTLYVAKEATVNLSYIELPASETLANKNLTIYGGIRTLSHMTADNGTTYGGTNYGVSYTYYNKYLESEGLINKAGNTEARANIEGNLVMTTNAHVLGGKINLSDQALDIINNHSSVQTYYKNYDYYAYISAVDLFINSTSAERIQSASSDKVCSSYNILPLVSKGKVVKTQNISSSFNSLNTTYDFSEGVFFSNSKTYAFIPSNSNEKDVSGNIREVTHDVSNHQIIYNNKRYSFYRNIFIENVSSTDGNIYVYDGSYSGYSTKGYNSINLSSNSVAYTYKYTATGTVETANYTQSRTRGSEYKLFQGYQWKDWNVSQEVWDSGVNLSLDESSIQTSNETKTTTNYNYSDVSINTYNYYSGISSKTYVEDYKSYSLAVRPSNCSKFSQNTTDINYYEIGTVSLLHTIVAGEYNTGWMINMSNPNITTSGDSNPGRNKTQTQTMTCQATLNNNYVEKDILWNINTTMYIICLKTSVKWNSTTNSWVRRT